MKTLLLMRHAKSSWNDAGLDDHDRPLNRRGQRDAPRIGRLIKNERLVPDLVLSSTAARARETSELVTENCEFQGVATLLPELYLSTPREIARQVVQAANESADRILVIAHNPGMEELLDLLTDTQEAMPTAALAQIEVEIDHWSDLSLDAPARLANYWRPRELG